MDNFKIDVYCEGTQSLHDALAIVLRQHRLLRGWSVEPATKEGKPTRMILYWMEDKAASPFPFDVSRGDMPQKVGRERDTKDRLPWLVDMVEGWLMSLDYGRQPNHDGDNGRGWRVYTESWGHVAGNHHTACAIEPARAWYGK